jgi:hypothetical protein
LLQPLFQQNLLFPQQILLLAQLPEIVARPLQILVLVIIQLSCLFLLL